MNFPLILQFGSGGAVVYFKGKSLLPSRICETNPDFLLEYFGLCLSLERLS